MLHCESSVGLFDKEVNLRRVEDLGYNPYAQLINFQDLL